MSTGNINGRIPHYESAQFPDLIPSAPAVPLPQTGKHPIELYMAALGQSRKAFLANLRILKVPVGKIGTSWTVIAEDLHEASMRWEELAEQARSQKADRADCHGKKKITKKRTRKKG